MHRVFDSGMVRSATGVSFQSQSSPNENEKQSENRTPQEHHPLGVTHRTTHRSSTREQMRRKKKDRFAAPSYLVPVSRT